MAPWSRLPALGRAPDASGEAFRRDVRRVHCQHAEIGLRLGDLDGRLAAARGATAAGETRAEIVGRLARLQTTLAEHFAEEERVGFVPRAVDAAPRLTRRARHIVSQHDLLRLRLAEVVATAERESSQWEDVHERFLAFTEALREHERLEGELINEALMDDLGGLG